MATDLYPTRTRLRLLADVDAGRVRTTPDSGYTFAVDRRDKRRVDAQIREVTAAGWVEQVDGGWRLTDAGRAVLEAGTQ